MEKMYSEKVRAQLRFLYPMQEENNVCRDYYKAKTALVMKILIPGMLLAVAIFYSEKSEPLLQPGNFISRAEAVSENREVMLRVKDTEGILEDVIFSYPVGEQRCTPEEIERKVTQFKGECAKLIQGENVSLEQVKAPLILRDSYEGYPMSFSWESNPYTLIDEDGNVNNGELSEKQYAELTVCMNYGETEYEYSFPVCVYPKDLTPARAWEKAIIQEVKKADEEQQYTGSVALPEVVEGKKIVYSEIKKTGAWYWFLFPVAAAILVFVAKDKDLIKLTDHRKRAMELKYPEFVSKFVLLLGAGMSVRGVLFKLSLDRSLGEELGQELQLLVRDIKNGISVKDALDRFGKRSQNPLYMKFSALLIQNIKKGTGDLFPMLEKEAGEAFLLRKNHAKQLGEEAGTKLLGPMMLQLVIVMAVIIVPAFLSFQL
nr:type II secretion system F family protein [Lachnospiraceae bacterium]